ncbi:2'-5' RNA ligase [Afipia massiliensis]|uniref:2'-5' RNA ligase n=1 Tax=Afipia massiliensis TaxID=211460 RepID=A0A840N0B0_9BRAD|nr:2'-5' RNA ligase family protein [Afipia massiliensis]MBB5051408.1 2'-5' RNA ligase [Afipia massiliensis]
MSEQLVFPGFPMPRAMTDRLFFAVVPPAVEQGRIMQRIQLLRAELGLTGQPLLASCLHISLHGLGDYWAGLPEALVEAAMRAGGNVSTPPFEISFERAMSFYRRQRTRAFVLRTRDDTAALSCLHRALGDCMKAQGLGNRVASHFTPHMTLLYDVRLVDEHVIEPLRWDVTELVLVHSLLGRRKHVHLAHWPLRS